MQLRKALRSIIGVRFIFLFSSVLLLSSGCASSRGTLDINVQPVLNPTSGTAVRIVQVRDMRVFEKEPKEPFTPSLKDGAIEDMSITSRAIARKRNSYGVAMGDILLPEGRTVAGLVEEAVGRSFRESGFIVRHRDDAGYGDALPVEIDIDQFWGWARWGFWTFSFEFESRLNIKAPLKPFEQGETVRGYAHFARPAGGSSVWQGVIDEGIADLITNIRARFTAERTATIPGVK